MENHHINILDIQIILIILRASSAQEDTRESVDELTNSWEAKYGPIACAGCKKKFIHAKSLKRHLIKYVMVKKGNPVIR